MIKQIDRQILDCGHIVPKIHYTYNFDVAVPLEDVQSYIDAVSPKTNIDDIIFIFVSAFETELRLKMGFELRTTSEWIKK